MRRSYLARVCLSLSALLLAMLACDFPGSSSEADEVDHAATRTKRALETEVAHAKETAQPGDEGSATPGERAYAVMVSVSVDTDCRLGPGDAYEYVGSLLVGDEAEVMARSDDGMFFYIQLPNVPLDDCWIWAQYAQVQGELREVAVYTPPPPPMTTATPTVEPGLVVQGHVRTADGTGVEGVTICRRFASYDGVHVATTNADGYYQSDFSFIPGDEMITVWAFHDEYNFDPPDYFWRHYYGYEVATRDFSAAHSAGAESSMPDCR